MLPATNRKVPFISLTNKSVRCLRLRLYWEKWQVVAVQCDHKPTNSSTPSEYVHLCEVLTRILVDKVGCFDEGNVVIFIPAVWGVQKRTSLICKQLLLQKLLSKREFLLRVIVSLYLRVKDYKQQLLDAKIILYNAIHVTLWPTWISQNELAVWSVCNLKYFIKFVFLQ